MRLIFTAKLLILFVQSAHFLICSVLDFGLLPVRHILHILWPQGNKVMGFRGGIISYKQLLHELF